MLKTQNPDLSTRAKTAGVLIILFLSFFGFALYSDTGRGIFAVLVFLLVTLASFEFSRIPKDQKFNFFVLRFLLLIFPSFIILAFGIANPFAGPWMFLSVLLGTVVTIDAVSLSLLCMRGMGSANGNASQAERTHIEALMSDWGRDSLGALLLRLGGSSAVGLALLSPLMAFELVVIVGIADTAAYFAGRAFGRHKIAAIVSPKKTVVGTLAGILAGGFVGMMLLIFSENFHVYSWIYALFFSIALVVCSQAGDYAKSIVKRRFDVKDFGNILPGHGGVLDRLDGVLGAAPLALIFVVIVCSR